MQQGRQAAVRGDWQRARELFEAALEQQLADDVLEDLGWAGWWLADEQLTLVLERLSALKLLARASVRDGDAETARGACTAVEAVAAAFNTPCVTGRARLLAAEVAASQREPAAAVGELTERELEVLRLPSRAAVVASVTRAGLLG